MSLNRNIFILITTIALLTALNGCGGVSVLPGSVLPPGLLLNYNPQTGNAPLAVSFNISAETRDGSKPYITFNAGEPGIPTRDIANGSTIHVYAQPGTYTTTINARDGLGQVSSISVDVTAN